MRPRFHPRRAVVAAALGLVLAPLAARAYDAAPSFTPATNNPGAMWTYGSTPTRGGAFTLLPTHGTASGLDFWANNASGARVEHNPTLVGVKIGSDYTPVLGLNIKPGSNGVYGVIRWTAPDSGLWVLNVHFQQRELPPSSALFEVAVLANGATVVFDRLVGAGAGTPSVSVTASLALAAGQTIDLATGPGSQPDAVGIDATVLKTPTNLPAAGPVFTFAGERYAGCRWGVPGTTSAFESIAFDPLNRRLASEGHLRDLCGHDLSTGPDEQPGLAWDSRTGAYWQLTGDRVVRRWTAAGALLDTVFTIPLTFSVPGSGADTLESPRGIATDSNFVYVVDAGPLPGVPASGEWFKFTRAGVPVKSSKSTDFSAHLDLDPDAVVDDVCYVPFASPALRGRLLVALEHSGLQIIDTDGNFVGTFRWSAQGLTGPRPLSALSGVAVDPATGNLWLCDNGTGAALALARLGTPAPASYVLGTTGTSGTQPGAMLKLPNPGCDLRLWSGYALPATSSGNVFGVAYRPANRMVYFLDFGIGELWRFEPRLGAAERVGSTGLQGVWGVACDPGRDVLYTAAGFPAYIVVIDPASGAASTLPQPVGFPIGGGTDLAFDPADQHLYAVNSSTLLRIDRDTGVAAVVGVTAPALGLDYDAAAGRLIGDDSAGHLWAIDPATGAFQLLATMPDGIGWEGLAVVPVPEDLSVAAIDPPGPALADARILAFPNPTRGGANIDFALPFAGPATVGVYDVAGRRVRELLGGVAMAGPHRVSWDGRDAGGRGVQPGVYFVRLDLPRRTWVARLVTIR